MKKATSKRDRKYGKKSQEGIKVTKSANERVVKVMVDYAMIMKFKNKEEAKAYISKSHKEADERGHPKASYIFI